MIDNNEVYVLRQPKKSILTIVYIDNIFPKNQIQQDFFDEINSVSDILFIFNSLAKKKINVRKFTYLNKGSAFYVEDVGKPVALYNVLDYSKHIFDHYVSYVVLDDKDIENITDDKYAKNIQTWTSSTLSQPYIKIKRLDPISLYDIYKLEDNGKFFNFSRPVFDDKNTYSTYTSVSAFVFFKRNILNAFLDYEEKYDFKYLETFDKDSYKEAIASFIKDNNINYLENIILNESL